MNTQVAILDHIFCQNDSQAASKVNMESPVSKLFQDMRLSLWRCMVHILTSLFICIGGNIDCRSDGNI